MVAKYTLAAGLGILLNFLGPASINAAPVSATYTGALSSESGTAGSVVLESFTLAALSDVTIYTTSYGGGMNLDGSTSGAGGFQSNLTLFDSTGAEIANQSPSFSPIANADPVTGFKGDGYLQDTDLTAGTYYVTLTDWQNQMSITSTGLDLSQPAYLQFSGPGGNSFMDVMGNTRTGSYGLDILSQASAVPEPASFLLIVPAIAGLALLRKKGAVSSRS